MLKLLLSRLATAIPSVIGVVVVTFMLTRMLPGDPAAYFAGLAASPQAIAEIRTKLGLDKSLPEQFVAYIVDLAHGNLGNSLSTGQSVVSEIANRLPASAELTLVALLVAVSIAIPLGVLAAVKQGTWIDHLCRIVTTAGVSLPVFFTGLLFAYVFYYLLQWAPAPTGRLDVFLSPPPDITGFYLIDFALARDGDGWWAAFSQILLPAFTGTGIPSEEEIKEYLALDAQILGLAQPVAPSSVFDFTYSAKLTKNWGSNKRSRGSALRDMAMAISQGELKLSCRSRVH